MSPPLVVDLNGTLIKTDNLVEAVVTVLLRRPEEAWGMAKAGSRGRGNLKAHIAALEVSDYRRLPLRPDVVAFISEERSKGREVHLVTAADQSVAEGMMARTGLFDSAMGSRAGHNLKGRNKLAALQQRFPDGFSYAGNTRPDLQVWAGAKSIVLVATDATTRRKALSLGLPVEREFAGDRLTLRVFIKSIRLHQWVKNLLLFVPLLLAQKYGDTTALIRVALGFVAFGCVASGTYLINDLSDLDADRGHATKRNRPIASGLLGAASAMLVALTLIGAGLAGAVLLSLQVFTALGAYLAITLAYSLALKKVPMLDVFILGLLYTLRIFIGTVLAQTVYSPWLLSFTMFFFFSLSMAKRHVEIVRAAAAGQLDGLIKGRGYKASDAPLTLAFGVSSSLASILILFLYIVHEAFPAGAYRQPQWLWLIGFLLFLWTSRIWLLSHRGELDDDPVVFAIKDPASLFIGLLVAATFVMAVL